MAVAVLVALAVGMRQTAHVIGNWRSTRLLRRKEKIDALHREGTHAIMSKRTVEAIGLFERALAMDPNRVDSLLWLETFTGSNSNFAEAIRLHQRANRVDERNIEILLELANDLEGASYEDALQALQKMLKIEPDNLTALMRKRDLLDQARIMERGARNPTSTPEGQPARAGTKGRNEDPHRLDVRGRTPTAGTRPPR